MSVLYVILLRLYYILVFVFSAFNTKANLWIVGRKGWLKKMRLEVDSTIPTAWFHCASLGEFEQGRPIIEGYKQKYPSHKVLITFFSPSGFMVRKNYKGADYVYYLPLDTQRNAKRFLDIVKPVVAVFIKYEFWHNFLKELKRREVPTYLASAIFRKNQIFFRWYGAWNRRMLHCFNHIFLQNAHSQELLKGIGITNTTVAGDTRFDRVYATAKLANKISELDEFCGKSTVIVAGSTWPKDEELLVDFINSNPHNAKVIIAPHEINGQQIEHLQGILKVKSVRFTNYNSSDFEQAQVLILDTIGQLASAYSYGMIAYVGGGFGVGIHNTLEPATFGIPIIFGPNYHKFQEAKDLIKTEAAFTIGSSEELFSILNSLISNKEYVNKAGENSKRYVEQNIGATEKILISIAL